jgi:hypothetical protein
LRSGNVKVIGFAIYRGTRSYDLKSLYKVSNLVQNSNADWLLIFKYVDVSGLDEH